MEEHVRILQECLDNDFTIVKFFRKLDCSFSQKEQSKEELREALKILASKDDDYSRKAKNLLGRFDDYTNSYSVEQFWNSLKIREEQDKSRTEQFLLGEKKKQHLFLIDSNVVTEHNRSSNRLLSESDISVPKQNHNLRRKRSLDIDENETFDLINGDCWKLFNNFRKNSGNDKPDDVIIISDDEATYDEDVDYSISFNFDKLEEQLVIECSDQWKVGKINVTKKFRQYQQDLLHDVKYGIKVLTWKDTFDVLALGSIIVLDWPCPYNTFTDDEWIEVTDNNPYKLTEPVLNTDLTSALHDATFKKSLGLIADFIDTNDNSKHSNLANRIFCGLADDVPIVTPRKISEDEHRFRYLDPFLKIFGGPYKNYELRLNRTVNGSQKRLDFACVVDNVPILNSEIKPIGYTELQRDKDYAKVHFRAKKTINTLIKNGGVPDKTVFFINMGNTVKSFIMDLEFAGIYRSWPFLKTKLVTDRQSLPFLTQTLSHFIALEERVNNLAGEYKCRPRSSKQARKDQLKKLLK